MWLWTLSTTSSESDGASMAEDDEPDEDVEEEAANVKSKVRGFVLEYDAARKIAHGSRSETATFPYGFFKDWTLDLNTARFYRH
jgi:hypothetical protein